MSKHNLSLNNILDDEFLSTLAKSADLYKIGSNSVLDPEEIRIGLKVVPRAVMSMLISELSPMQINTNKQIKLPFGPDSWISVNKNAADDYTGSVYSVNKLVYDFKNRSIPGLGLILLSTFELYDLEELAKPTDSKADLLGVQKLIDERMELHSLIGKVVENKIAEREAIHKIMMDKLTEALSKPKPSIATSAPSIATNPVAIPPIATNPTVAPIEIKPSDMVKKENSKKQLPLKKFLDRKKKTSQEYHVEMTKSETRDCDSCGKTIFGESGFSSCLCFGENMGSKIWVKKSNDSVEIRFSKNWTEDNIEMLLEILRGKHGQD